MPMLIRSLNPPPSAPTAAPPPIVRAMAATLRDCAVRLDDECACIISLSKAGFMSVEILPCLGEAINLARKENT